MGFLTMGCSLYYCRRTSETPNGQKRSLPPLLVDKLIITTLKNPLVFFFFKVGSQVSNAWLTAVGTGF